jgi:hypothetical protein
MNIFLAKDLNQVVVALVQPYEAVYLKSRAQVNHTNGMFAPVIDNMGVRFIGERKLLV